MPAEPQDQGADAQDKAHDNPGAMIARQQRLKVNEVPPRLKPLRPNESCLVRHRITSPYGESESQPRRHANFFTRSFAGHDESE
jgi:hypothetical protein